MIMMANAGVTSYGSNLVKFFMIIMIMVSDLITGMMMTRKRLVQLQHDHASSIIELEVQLELTHLQFGP
jgi:hypothetical protein